MVFLVVDSPTRALVHARPRHAATPAVITDHKVEHDFFNRLSVKDMPLTLDERQQFLAQPHIAALAVAAGPGRGPLTVPIWYQYAPGAEVWVLTGPESQKIRLIRETGRFCLMVQQLEPTVRYVSAEGPVTRIIPRTDEMHREMAARYLPADKVDAYLKAAEAWGDQVAVHMRPEHWLSADLGDLREL
jgi:hypothetical protein